MVTAHPHQNRNQMKAAAQQQFSTDQVEQSNANAMNQSPVKQKTPSHRELHPKKNMNVNKTSLDYVDLSEQATAVASKQGIISD